MFRNSNNLIARLPVSCSGRYNRDKSMLTISGLRKADSVQIREMLVHLMFIVVADFQRTANPICGVSRQYNTEY